MEENEKKVNAEATESEASEAKAVTEAAEAEAERSEKAEDKPTAAEAENEADEVADPSGKKEIGRGTVSVKAFIIFCILLVGLLVICLVIAFGDMNGKIKKISETEGTPTEFESVSWTELYNKYIDTIVVVTGTTLKYDSSGGYTKSVTRGSGVIFTSDGFIITNNHIIDEAMDITVTTYEGVVYTADLISADAKVDIAVLKIPCENCHYAEMASSEVPPVGTAIAVIGNPLGYNFSITQGCIGGVDRSVVIDGNEMTLMQLSAPINSGNSGGGVFNSDGKVIGIVNAKLVSTSVEGIGFAISAKDAMTAAHDLMEYGYIRGRFNLGITMTTEFTSSTFKLGYPGCVMIIAVAENSNAAKGGLEVRDRILSIKYGDTVKEITALSDVTNILKECSMGDKLIITVYRNGVTDILEVTLDESLPSSDSSINA